MVSLDPHEPRAPLWVSQLAEPMTSTVTVLLWLVLLQMQRFWDLLTSQGLAYGPLYSTLHDAIYLVDVVWATFGYALSCTLLDSHVRSVEPTILGEWQLSTASFHTVCFGSIRPVNVLVLGERESSRGHVCHNTGLPFSCTDAETPHCQNPQQCCLPGVAHDRQRSEYHSGDVRNDSRSR